MKTLPTLSWKTYGTAALLSSADPSQQGEFVCEVLGMFDELETVGLTEKLVILFNIVKHMVCLNNPDLILCILHDDNFPAFVGLMECTWHHCSGFWSLPCSQTIPTCHSGQSIGRILPLNAHSSRSCRIHGRAQRW